jgi:GTP-binding protein
MSKTKPPKIVIVGRTNVGKSTLFNRLSENVKSITLDQEGVTRDPLKDYVSWQGYLFELIDTGGISLRKTDDIILEQTRKQALAQLEEAAVILFMCDGKVGVLPEDREISRLLHKLNKPIFLIINKLDSLIAHEHLHEFNALGHEKQFELSAQHGTGIAELLEAIVLAISHKPPILEQEKPQCRVVILGKPNVGKSSLLNLLLKQERSIVSAIPGTTREPISENLQFYNETIELTDTPGIRRKRVITDQLETMMVKTAMGALKNADIILLMVDASEGKLSDQELKLLFYAFEEHHKAVILLFNKQDKVESYEQETMGSQLDQYKYIIKKLAHLNISCKTGKNVGHIISLIEKVRQRYAQTIPDDELTFLFKEALVHKPLYKQGMMLRVARANQIQTSPITIALRVNLPQFFDATQFGYLESMMRKKYDLQGVPIHFIARKH